MAIAFDASSSVQSGGNSDITLSHTCTGSDRLLMVGISTEYGGVTPSGVTYNGVAMTQVGSAVINTDSFANAQLHVYRLIAPASGANNIVASFSGPPGDRGVVGVSFTGVDQTTPLGTAQTGTQNNTSSPSKDCTSGATGDLIVDFQAAHSDLGSATAGSGQTSRAQALGGRDVICSTEAGAASVTMSWSVGSSRWFAQMVIPIKAAGGAAWTPRVIRLGQATRRASNW